MTELAAGACRGVLVDPSRPPVPCPERGEPYCARHAATLDVMHPASASEFLAQWKDAVVTAVAGRASGDGDPHSHDSDVVRALLPLGLPLYSLYWRVEVFGISNVPGTGPAMLAANHSGTLPIDGAMLKVAMLKEHGRNPWLLAADLVFEIPLFRDLVRIAGNARANREETVRLLRSGELIGVFPEGFKGVGKGWKRRYQVQRFGRGGLVEVAMETGAPIVPVAIIGAEEAYPMIANLGFFARRFGLPYFPITPTWPLLGPLGILPLPSKWIIAFGEPIPMIGYGRRAIEDLQLVLEQTELVRARVQGLLDEYLPKRRHTFL